MKNFNLLLATTAILSTAGLMAKAGDVISYVNGANVAISPEVKIIDPINLTSNQELSFGTIISPQANDTVTITVSGISATGSATLVDKNIGTGTDQPHQGILRSTSVSDFVESAGDPYYQIVRFPTEPVTLVDDRDGYSCGTVTFDNTGSEWVSVGDPVTSYDYKYGGTFKATGGEAVGNCSGDAVVTVILRDSN